MGGERARSKSAERSGVDVKRTFHVALADVAFGTDSGLTISCPGRAGIRAKAVVPLRARRKLCPEMFLKLVTRGWWRCGSYFQWAHTLRCRPQAAYCGAAGSGGFL